MKDITVSLIFPIIVSIVSYIIIDTIGKRKKKEIFNCSEHYIFSRLKSIKKINIAINFKLKNKGKELIFKSILESQIDCIIEEAISIVTDVKGKKEDDAYIRERLSDGLDSIFSKLYTFYMLDDSHSQEDKNTIKKVMDKFYKINEERVNRLYENIIIINSSVFYKSYDDKVCAFFDMLISLVQEQLSTAEATFNNINGDLKGLIFKGVVIK